MMCKLLDIDIRLNRHSVYCMKLQRTQQYNFQIVDEIMNFIGLI